ncbi:MAG: ribosome maturation factor RimM [Tannerellaceae bacterium]|jgi:16S rRNA processing protein RimM|nr:ribosome maturation factor RimM [Tannerellaceae bacterium]
MIEKETVRKIGYFTKPHGIKGEIGLVLSFDIFSHTDDLFVICEIEGILVPFYIEEYRSKNATTVLVKLETIRSEEAVRMFSNREVYYPLRDMDDQTPDTTENSGWAKYMGYAVSDHCGNLGEITAIDETTANTLLCINKEGKELLVPAVEEWIVAADHAKKELHLSIPEGLSEL